MYFDGHDEGECDCCGMERVLDSGTSLCKDCWREYASEQEKNNHD